MCGTAIINLSSLPKGHTRRAASSPHIIYVRGPLLFGLAPGRVYPALDCCQSGRWALTPPFHPYPAPFRLYKQTVCGAVCFLWHFPFSRDIALETSGFPEYPALWCSDFPPPNNRERSPGLLGLPIKFSIYASLYKNDIHK